MDQIFNTCFDVFNAIYTSGQILWVWLSTPLVEEEGAEPILSFIAGKTPFELMFSAFLITILTFWIVKFVVR